METPKYGEIKCQAIYASGQRKGKQCENGAYYSLKEMNNPVRYLCGTHSNNSLGERNVLVKMSPAEKKAIKDKKVGDMLSSANSSSERNTQADIILHENKSMFKKPEPLPSYLDIYPNAKSGWQGIGHVYPQLSPMTMGPVNHGQKDLPSALLLENFHQGNKRFEGETDEEFSKSRLDLYKSNIPQRHKPKSLKKNVPLHSVWINKDGKEIKLSYVESRQLYCNFYERLALQTKEFKAIKAILDQKINIRIIGPDAGSLDRIDNPETAYLDPFTPFGHERVLYTMLRYPEAQWPWRKYKTLDF